MSPPPTARVTGTTWLAYDLLAPQPSPPLGVIVAHWEGAIVDARRRWPDRIRGVQVISPEHAHILVAAGILSTATPPSEAEASPTT